MISKRLHRRSNRRPSYSLESLEGRVLLSVTQLFVANNDGTTVGEYTTAGATVNASVISGLAAPIGVAVSGSDIFVLNPGSNSIGEYTTAGATVNASLISGLGGGDSEEGGIAISGSDLFVTDYSGGTIGEYTTSGATVNASLISGLSGPNYIAVSGSDLFVTDSSNNTIGEYTTSGATVNASLISGLDFPIGIAISGSDIFVVNNDSMTVGEYTTSGTTVNASLISGFDLPEGIAVSGSDLFVADATSNTIGEYTTSGATVNASLVSGLTGPCGIALAQAQTSATHLAFATQPTSGAAGAALSPIKVDVDDASGSVVSTDTSTVTLTLSSATFADGKTSESAAASGGVATFSNLKIDAAGNYTLTATDGSLTSAISSAFTISAGAASKLHFDTEPPGTTAAGDGFGFATSVEDQFGNPVLNDGSTVSVSLSSNSFASGSTSVAAAGGVATFSTLKIDAAGSYTVTATDGSLTQATSSTFTISAAAAAKLRFDTEPANASAGSVLPAFTVSVQDQFGNTVTSATSTVAAALSGNAFATGSTTSVSAVAGVATFNNLKIDAAASNYTITATDGALTAAASTPAFAISPAAAAILHFNSQPGSSSVGIAISPFSVSVEDQFGNLETTTSSTVSLALNNSGVFAGGAASVAAAGGIATFANLVIDTPAIYQMTATAIGVSPATSNSFTINSLPPVFSLNSPVTVSASMISVGSTSTITLHSKNEFGNNLTTGGLAVAFSLTGPGTSSGTIGAVTDNNDGTYSATFTATTAGTAIQIAATINGSAVTSALPSITVTPQPVPVGPFDPATSTVSVSTVYIGSTGIITLQAKDSQGANLTTGGLSNVMFTLTGVVTQTLIAVDNRDGTYSATFPVNTPGGFTVGTTVNGAAVSAPVPATVDLIAVGIPLPTGFAYKPGRRLTLRLRDISSGTKVPATRTTPIQIQLALSSSPDGSNAVSIGSSFNDPIPLPPGQPRNFSVKLPPLPGNLDQTKTYYLVATATDPMNLDGIDVSSAILTPASVSVQHPLTVVRLKTTQLSRSRSIIVRLTNTGSWSVNGGTIALLGLSISATGANPDASITATTIPFTITGGAIGRAARKVVRVGISAASGVSLQKGSFFLVADVTAAASPLVLAEIILS